MIDTKQNRDLIIVFCDTCASNLKFYSTVVKNSMVTLEEMIEGNGWEVSPAGGHTCRACVRKGLYNE